MPSALYDLLSLETQQAAYAARPFAVRWIDSHFSATFRFHTLDEAHAYAQQQWMHIQWQVARHRPCASRLWQSRLITPTGSVQLAYVLLATDVSSY